MLGACSHDGGLAMQSCRLLQGPDLWTSAAEVPGCLGKRGLPAQRHQSHTLLRKRLLLRCRLACTSAACRRRDISHTPFFVDGQRLGSTSVQEVLEGLLQPDLRFSHAKLMSAGVHGPLQGLASVAIRLLLCKDNQICSAL